MGYVTKDSGQREEFGTGAVRDHADGKGRYDLISTLAMIRLALHLEAGAKKYDDRNWEKGIPMMRTVASLKRHLDQWIEGQDDEDHLAAVLTNAVFLAHFDEGIRRGFYGTELDDRPVYESVRVAPAPRRVSEAVATYTEHAEREYGEGSFLEELVPRPMREVQHTSDEQGRTDEQLHDWSHSENEGFYHVHRWNGYDVETFPSTPAAMDSRAHTHERR